MQALIFDCDGVIAETEGGLHLPAFNRALTEFGFDLQWTRADYADRLLIGGGKERIAGLLTPEFVASRGLPTDPEEQHALVAAVHARKTELLGELLDTLEITARPGVNRLAHEALDAGWKLAVASTSAKPAVTAIVRRVLDAEIVDAITIFAGDDVEAKKPDPAVYRLALAGLGIDATNAVAIEDSRIGLLAATGAGIQCLVTPSLFTAHEEFAEAFRVVTDLSDVALADVAAALT
jgi:beta-phosphoglucomutase-like phosphatase (HAD superfamily)